MSEYLGPITRLQIHAESLKRDAAYDASPLIAVDRATIDAAGLLGWDGTAWIIDTHHAAHPHAKGGGKRVLSIGFTGHYERMEERFGDVEDGIGGENIVVDGPAVTEADIADGFIVRTSGGAEIELLTPAATIACPGFTSHLRKSPVVLPREEIVDDLAFLSTGTRGFIVSVAHVDQGFELSVGDEVFKR